MKMPSPLIKPDVQGDFLRYPVPRLLFFLLKKEFLGRMEIQVIEAQAANVYFREGLPTYTDLQSTPDVLGRVLLESGLITEEAFHRSLQALASGNDTQGRILLRMGAIDDRGLIFGLQLQLQRKLNRLFSFTHASFALYGGEHTHGLNGEASLVRADPLRIIYHGVRNHFDTDRMKPELEKMRGLPLCLRPGFEKLRDRYAMGDEEQALITRLVKRAMAYELILQEGKMEVLQTQMMLYTLWVTEALIVAPAPEVSIQATPGVGAPIQADASPLEALVSPAIPAPPELVQPTIKENPPAPPQPKQSASPASRREPNGRPSSPGVPAVRSGPRPSTRSANPAASAQAAGELAAVIQKTRQGIESKNHFEVLGVEKNVSVENVRDAYFKLAKVFHPDRCSALGLSQLISQTEEIFRRVNEAHSVLTDPARRAEYEKTLEEGETGGQVQAALEAEFTFQKGVVLFRKKKFAEALRHFQDALRLNDQEGEHLAWVAWTCFSDPENNREEILPKVKAQLIRALALAPQNPTCNYFLGEVYLALGEEKQAKTFFFKTLEVQPDHIEANRHLRLMQMRREKKDEKSSGLFSRLRKK
jgi:tetratricopeptide (TPR) repeat protein